MTLALDVQVVARDLAVQLTVPTGQTCAVLGPNGAGKSTLLDLTAGLLRPDSGTIELAGRRLVGPDTWVPPHRRRVVLLSAQPRLFPHLSVLANVAFGPRSLGRSRRESVAIARSWLARVGADQWADRPVTTLSTGQAQRIALARALAVEPELLLLDEPFAGIDPIAVGDIQQLVRHLTQRGIGVLITDHNVRETLGLTDRAYIVYAGEVLTEGTPDEIVNDPDVRRLYLGEEFRL